MNDEISYISKEAALAIAKDRVFRIPHADGGWHKYRFRCIDPDDLRGLPAADVQPVKRGRWVHLGGNEWCCDQCGHVISTEGNWEHPLKDKEIFFCEHCGADLREAEE